MSWAIKRYYRIIEDFIAHHKVPSLDDWEIVLDLRPEIEKPLKGYSWSLLCYIHRITFCISIFAIRFRRIQIECNMVYDATPEEEDEICRIC